MSHPELHIAIPLMDEMIMISQICDAIASQTCQSYHVWICVNQPESWWLMPDKENICISNQKTIKFINSLKDSRITLIDRSSRGNGWDNTGGGAGWARKVIMDQIAMKANDHDLIISLDGDTLFGNEYFESITCRFDINTKKYSALSNPYYHNLTGNHQIDRALLRYEIYMRFYLINMFRINSPYAFTALGSAMVIPVWAYKAVSGITPVKSGEDFYFLQKLRKFRPILTWNSERAFPSGRLSDRVGFGTGPAIKAGLFGDWESYPIYDHRLFDKVKSTFDLFPDLYHHHVPTPMTDFLNNQFKTDDIWSPLRKNYPNLSRFIHACECKVDGLRILQFLRSAFNPENGTDESRLVNFLETYYPAEAELTKVNLKELSFANSDLAALNKIRNLMAEIEDRLRLDHDNF